MINMKRAFFPDLKYGILVIMSSKGVGKVSKEFNTQGICVPKRHYMVDITHKLKEIRKLVNKEAYFIINRARQYGKTTTLNQLRKFLENEYLVLSLSFQGLSDENFASSQAFCQEFLTLIDTQLVFLGISEVWLDEKVSTFSELSRHLTKKCKGRKIVLLIDEVDQASNHRVFLGFLGMLREKYLARSAEMDYTFHRVILAGVYDIKNIKVKMVQEGIHALQTDEKIFNSPWNIAASFEVDMSFSPDEIKTMLVDYQQNHQLKIEMNAIANEIYYYTEGYPVLVSAICRYIDEKLEKHWTVKNVQEAVRLMVRETDFVLFQNISQNLESQGEVYRLLYEVLINGISRSFTITNPAIDLAYRYAYIKPENGRVKISNKVFEMVMTNHFISKDELSEKLANSNNIMSEITRGNRFNMQLCLERFQVHWHEIYSEKSSIFLEKECRMLFLMYLKPLLNGVGFYFIESAFTDDRRMDVVVTYGNQLFVLELKTWKGSLYNEKGVEQLLGYMNKLGEEKGYLVTFDFRKKPENIAPQWRQIGDKQVFEVRI